jgi:hypothetical protein
MIFYRQNDLNILRFVYHEVNYTAYVVCGQWHISKKMSDPAWDSMAQTVIAFCTQNHIDYHIKHGTQS